MEIVLDIDKAIPAFVRAWTGNEVIKLVDQIRRLVRRGEIRPGDPLPSTRQLANDLEIDEKIVAKAYQLLERDALIETKGYRGVFVHRKASVAA